MGLDRVEADFKGIEAVAGVGILRDSKLPVASASAAATIAGRGARRD